MSHYLPEQANGSLLGALGLIVSVFFKWIYLETAIQATIAATVSTIVGFLVLKAIKKLEQMWNNYFNPKQP